MPAVPQAIIYLDTNLWNRLVDRNVDPCDLLSRLEEKSTTLALSTQTVRELAKTFVPAPLRGQQLFQFVKSILGGCTVGVCDVMEQLHREVAAEHAGVPRIQPLYNASEHKHLAATINALAKGEFGQETESHIAAVAEFSRSARSGQKAHLESKPDVRERLRAIAPNELGPWLITETHSDRGAALLVNHLERMYDEGLTPREAVRLAAALLREPEHRAARGLLRADLYANWRCAHRDSLRSDLIDDLYHVLNANYCDVYATAEANHAEYAHHILSPKTRVAIFDDRSPPDQWLLGLS